MSQPAMPPIKSVVLQRLWRRANVRNQNVLLGIFGPTGSGKSYSALRICCLLDPTFDESRIVFSAREFLHLLNSGNLKRGCAILWDESGVGVSARGWASESNRAVLDVLQSFRSSNLILVFTSPDLKFVDAGARRLFHLIAETKFIDRINRRCVLKIFQATHGIRNQKDYYKYPVISLSTGTLAQVIDLKVGMPRPSLVTAYERKKAAFLRELNVRLEARMIAADTPKANKAVDEAAAVKEILANPETYYGKWGGKKILKAPLIGARFGVGRGAAARIKASAESLLEGGKT